MSGLGTVAYHSSVTQVACIGQSCITGMSNCIWLLCHKVGSQGEWAGSCIADTAAQAGPSMQTRSTAQRPCEHSEDEAIHTCTCDEDEDSM